MGKHKQFRLDGEEGIQIPVCVIFGAWISDGGAWMLGEEVCTVLRSG